VSTFFKEQFSPTPDRKFCQGNSESFFRNVAELAPASFTPWAGAGKLRPDEAFPSTDCEFRFPMIEVEGLTKLYGDFVAVRDLSFDVQPGEVVGLVGPNGAGKTTTLRCLAGIIPPTRGAIRICGHALAQDPIAAKQQLAFFTDEPRLFDYLTVEQHLAFTARIYHVADYEPIAAQLLQELELSGKTKSLPTELSRGMKQKLAIACGLLHSPRVIYFDEPLTGLDPLGIRRMKDSILKRARAGAAIMISSHLLHLVEEICSHILILKDGIKIIDGTIEEITQKFSEQSPDANLEEVFFRATGGADETSQSVGGPPS
jgi:ABC-2 type transport system ATP-binding protein